MRAPSRRGARRLGLVAAAVLTAAAVGTVAVRQRAGAGRAAPPVVTAERSGVSRPVFPWTLGLNGENVTGPTYADPGFSAAVAAYRPGTLRYPGGTAANFWDWTRGWYQPRGPWPGEPARRIDASLPTFASMVRRIGATPVFDVNVVTWHGRIATDRDVSAMMADTLTLLHAASAAGLTVRRVELGNELYLAGPSPGASLYARRFATASQYASVADRYTTAITREFPGARVAASAAVTDYVDDISKRRQHWNDGLLSTLRATPAVTLHLNVRVHDGSLTPAEVIGTMVRQVRALAGGELPRLRRHGLAVWVTEFNMADTTPGSVFAGTWLHGLCVGTLAIELLALPGVTQLAMHNVTGPVQGSAIFGSSTGFGRGGPRTTPDALTAAGAVLGLVQEALRGARSTSPLRFDSPPPLGAGHAPGLLGTVAERGRRRTALLMNLTGRPVTVDLSGLGATAWSYRRAWAAGTDTKVASPGDVRRDSGVGTASVPLPPYGVALATS